MNMIIIAASRNKNSINEIVCVINRKSREILRDINKSFVCVFDTLIEALYEAY